MAKNTASKNVVPATEETRTVIRKVVIAPYGHVREWEDKKDDGTRSVLIIVPGLNPDGNAQFLKRAILFNMIWSNSNDKILLESYRDYLIKKGMDFNSALCTATRDLLAKMSIECTFTFHVEGEIYTRNDGTEGTFETDGWSPVYDSIRLIRPKELIDEWITGNFEKLFVEGQLDRDFE